MAGSILIAATENIQDGGTGFGYNTSIFEIIAEGIRAGFEESESECMKKCFEDVDETYMQCICLYEIDPPCFQKFVAACERGLRTLRETREFSIDIAASDAYIDGVAGLWEELLAELRADPRMRGVMPIQPKLDK